jgi:sulfide:quinone oxidoreductase
MNSGKTKVLIAGGGVAALEAAIALRELAADLVHVELLAPNHRFTYGALSVMTPFEEREPVELELAQIARELGASIRRGRLTGIDAWRHLAHMSTNVDVEYDALLVACGALPVPAVPGALTFRGPADVTVVQGVLDEIRRGDVDSVAFVVPWGAAWSLPVYELALLTAKQADARVEVAVVTPEFEPLQLFGEPASDAVRELLVAHGVELRSGSYVEAFADGELRLLPTGTAFFDRVIALPRLVGAPIDGVPQTIEGFVPVDRHGRVHGLTDVYAAGDITAFPVKHGGLATQEALAAAQMIASLAGADVDPQPFRPVVQGLLLTGGEPRFLRRELGGGLQQEPVASYEPLWWPPAKIVGRHLAPFLALHAGSGVPATPARESGVHVEVPLEPETLSRLDVGRLPADLHDLEEEPILGGLTTSLPVVVAAPEDTLGEIAEHMLEKDVSAVLVVEYGRLVGIIAKHDLMKAYASRAHPSEARARQWMTAQPVTLGEDAPHAAAARLMLAYGVHHLPLVHDERPVGLLYLEHDEPVPAAVGLGF